MLLNLFLSKLNKIYVIYKIQIVYLLIILSEECSVYDYGSIHTMACN